MSCLLPFVYTCEYVVGCQKFLVAVLYCHIVTVFGNPSGLVAGVEGLSPKSVFGVVLGFEFGVHVRVRGDAT